MAEQDGVPQSTPPSCQNDPCSSTATTIRIYQAIIFALPVLFTVILILLFWLIYLRHRRAAQPSPRLRQQFFARSLFYAQVDRGLCKIFRDTLPVTIYDDNLAATLHDCQCPVCLNNFEPNENLRQLPVCGHCFHLDCIDEWIRSNSTCPICRSTLIVTRKVVPINSSICQPVGPTDLPGAENNIRAETSEPNEAARSGTSGGSDGNAVFSEVVDGVANV
ncbi:hypothetical protein O6H91_20G001800 [Diphasiastrum complanatum]|uniref:Uncharacterized protein n=1 Tax=Diphasiastrum complanatum TaxID=34168 RepID=A0ACC2AM65_DIPCM|nr:hypothetical protein O6H91_20G001800 [Diphasiastrum complanatum]